MHTTEKIESEKAISDCIGTVPQDVIGNTVKKRGRPRKRKHSQEQRKVTSEFHETFSHDVNDMSTVKKGRPVMYSKEEKKKRIKESKLKHYHKTKQNGLKTTTHQNRSTKKHSNATNSLSFHRMCDSDISPMISEDMTVSRSKRGYPSQQSVKCTKTSVKRGRPIQYSPEEKVLKDREKKLRAFAPFDHEH